MHLKLILQDYYDSPDMYELPDKKDDQFVTIHKYLKNRKHKRAYEDLVRGK